LKGISCLNEMIKYLFKQHDFMKKASIVFGFCTLIAISGFSQSKAYWSAGGEMLFSWASIKDNGVGENSTLRWAPVFNLQGRFNKDLSDKVGIFTGLFMRNVGYIYDNYRNRTLVAGVYGNPHKEKFRSYNVGIPVGIKIGNLGKTFFYGCYGVEFPFH